eukprot:TRINITY_DN5878_c0_g1_i2.p1 TRINITY_DN5878_c0_g1~~TRINITY_DN5878_c0_g1_i2.p1  ORF type:complete len:283 (-),score=59.83 TRINITY_DN5878_c0_g1_i2:305-1153(-)
MHYNTTMCLNKAPLNPVLGETLQANRSDGSQFFAEQISHHPPVTAYILIGKDNAFKIRGTGELRAELDGVNSIRGTRIGKSVIEFADKSEIQISNPEIKINGLVMGERILNFVKSTIFIDKKNKLWADVFFNLDESGSIAKIAGKLKNWWNKKNESHLPTDYLTIKISRYEKLPDGNISKEVIAEGSGSWLEFVQMDEQVFWKITDEIETWNLDLPDLLPSNSKFRLDSIHIKAKDYDKAQIEKEKLEDLQRHDAKLRKEYAAKRAAHHAQEGDYEAMHSLF